ncbi:MAG: A/G-specific adenine glycosylase [Anaerolineae bacterium]
MHTPGRPDSSSGTDKRYGGRCSEWAEPLSTALLQWYAVYGRTLPWRTDPSPYHTWVSEIMLQQTQVTAVIPYYQRFLTRFPDLETLANSDLSELLALWQGLGYYTRARHLHAAAGEIVRRHQGHIPAERGALLALPGIGVYTAGAILSIAFNLDYVAVDGNVKRILARILDYSHPLDSASSHSELAACAHALLPAGRASTFNQALMDLGATVCRPRRPLCHICPVGNHCLARAHGVQDERPVRPARAPVPLREMVGAYIENDGCLWLAVHRRPQGLLGGLWEIPNFVWAGGDDLAMDTTLAALLADSLALKTGSPDASRVVSHAYTHFRVRLTVARCTALDEPRLGPHDTWDEVRWLDDERMASHGLTGLTLKALAAVRNGSVALR